jgi:hypothetical protein
MICQRYMPKRCWLQYRALGSMLWFIPRNGVEYVPYCPFGCSQFQARRSNPRSRCRRSTGTRRRRP